MAMVDYFLKLDGIEGESQDSKHKGEIELQSYSFGGHQAGTHMSGGGGGAGKVSLQDLSFVMAANKASVKLFLACCTGEHIKSAAIEFSQSTGDRLVWMSYKFTDVMVSGFNISGAPSGVDRPQESVSISFSKWEQKYQPTDNKGALGGAIPAGYDLKLNKKV